MAAIDKLAWIEIQERRVLFVRSAGKDLFYTPGGKREGDETDVQALARELEEELGVKLQQDTARFLRMFSAQAHGKPEGVMVEMKCYEGTTTGALTVGAEIAEMVWLMSSDKEKTTVTGAMVLDWLKAADLID
jgi:8-oxo-dGTP pyrophosphatase MutT (NUDIX family)